MREARWRTFGHMLRLDRRVPAQRAMDYYSISLHRQRFEGDSEVCKTTSTTVLTRRDLDKLRSIAADREAWKALSKQVTKRND